MEVVWSKPLRAYNTRGQMPQPSGHVGRTPWWSPADVEPWIETVRAHRRANLPT